MKKAWSWAKTTRAWRTWRLFSDSGGNLSAAGMSFQALFAVFAAVYIGFRAASVWLNDAPELRETIIKFVNVQIPGLISTGGPIDPKILETHSTIGWSSAIAAVLLIWTAIAWLNYTRIAIRHVFGLPTPPVSALLLKVYDLFIALFFGIFVVASAAVSVFLSAFIKDVAAWLGWQPDATLQPLLLQIGGFLVLYAMDTLILSAIILLLSGIPIPPRRVLAAAALGALALEVVKIGAGVALNSTGHNPLLASFAIFVGLLVWFNLNARIWLLTAAWIGAGLQRDNISAADLGWIIPKRHSRTARTARTARTSHT